MRAEHERPMPACQAPLSSPSDDERFVARFLPDAAALAAALAQPGCPLCRLGAAAVDACYAQLARPDAPPDLVEALARAHGFCFAHGWEATHRLPPSVLARLLGPALAACRQVAGRLAAAAALPPTARAAHQALRRARAALAPPARCPLCTVEAAAVTAGAQLLLAALARVDGAAAYRASEGLCVRHARQALAAAPPEAVPLLLERLAAPLDALLTDIEQYYRKATWEFAHEPKGAEQQAWLRGIARWAGARRAVLGGA
ncbi:MAG TPA: hypothetical protein VFB73_11150 [Chloroflexota bacterium]|nr:hypothetical protein [Chloroflexota bacterium]